MVQTIASPVGVEAATFQGSDFCYTPGSLFLELLHSYMMDIFLFFCTYSSVDAILGESLELEKNKPLEVRRFRNWTSFFSASTLKLEGAYRRTLPETNSLHLKMGHP